MKKLNFKVIKLCFIILIIGLISSTKYANGQFTNPGFETGDLSGWVGSSGTAVSAGMTVLSWTVSPSDSYMASIEPITQLYISAAESNLGLPSGALVSANSGLYSTATNFATLTQSITLTAGQTIKINWNFIAQDYAPYNDGVIATLVGPSYQRIRLLAVTANPFGDLTALITGDYGSTGWLTVTFTAGNAGTYLLGFASFNTGDEAVNPIMLIDDGVGGTFEPGAPILNTNSISSIGSSTATSGGDITSDGGTPVTARGICWNTSGLPTTSDNKTSDGTGTGTFTSNMTALSSGTTYYVRAYATNLVATVYGSQLSFITSSGPVIPTLSTSGVSSITQTTASAGGNISSDGGDVVTERGVCWNTSGSPTRANSKTSDGSGTGSFTSSITGLSAGTTYYIRAYSTNSIGTAYGNEVSFATLRNPQTVTFNPLPTKTFGDSDITPVASASSGLAVTFSSSNTDVATIVSSNIHIAGAGTAVITASQAGDATWLPASSTQTLTVNKSDQAITFGAIPAKTYGNTDFDPLASATSGSTIAYSSNNAAVVTIVSGKIHITGAGTANIAANQPGNTNYNAAAQVIQILTVSKAMLTVTSDPKTKVYGSSNPALTIWYSGFVNEDDAADINTAPSATTSVNNTTPSGVVTNAILPSGGIDDNYDFTYVADDFTVTKAMLTVTSDPMTKVYGAVNPPLTFQYSGWLNGDDATDLTTAPIVSTAVSNTTNVGVVPDAITVGGGVDENYNFTYVANDFTVTKAMLTVTSDPMTKVYGAANPALTFQYSGWLNGDDATDLTTAPTAFTAVSNTTPAGVVTDAILASGGVDDNYDFTYVADDFTVTKAMLTVTSDPSTKVYGAVNPPLTFQYSGWLNGDNATDLTTAPTAFTAVSNTTPAGVVTDAILASGGSDDNYDFTYVADDFTVTKAMLTVTSDPKTKVYGAANPALTFRYSGWLNGDDATDLTTAPTAFTAVSNTTPAGVVADAILASGGVDDNYDFTYVADDFTITKAMLTVTSDPKTKVYGAVNPPLTFQYSGWLNGDDATDLATVPVATSLVSNITPVGVVPDAITVAGGVDENYDFTYVADDFTIIKAMLTVTSDPSTKVYGAVNPPLTIWYSGWLNGDDVTDLTTVPTAFTAVSNTTPAGVVADAIIASGGVDDNYNFTYVADDFTVTKAMLTVTSDPKTKVYGAANPALTFQYSGWLNGDDATDLTTAPTAFTAVSNTTNVGVVPDAITVGGGVDENYNFTYVANDFTVTKAMLTITSDPRTKVYGAANPALTFQYSGWLNGDDATDLTTAPTAFTAVSNTTPAGVVTDAILASGGVDDNYDFTYVADDFTVTKAMLTVTSDPRTKVYGAVNPPLTFQYSGWLNGDDATDLTTAPTAFTAVSNTTPAGVVTDAILASGGSDDNYDFTYVADDFTVTKAMLTVTSDPKTKVYGAANPALTFRYSGWLNGDDATDLTTAPTAFTAVSNTTPAGVVADAILASGGVDDNYDFTYVADDFTITKAMLTVTSDPKTKVYGAVNPPLTFQYSGWLNGDDATDLATVPVATSLVSNITPVGVVPDAITVAGGVDENYDFTYVADDFTIIKAMLTVTSDPSTKVYGAVNPPLTFQYSGWLNGDDVTDLTTVPTAFTTVSNTTPAGVVADAIIASGGVDDNYDFTYVPDDFTVTKAMLTVTSDPQIKVYGAPNPTLTFRYGGFVNGEDKSSLTTEPLSLTTVGITSSVGMYTAAITTAGGTDDNYSFTYAPADFTVTKAMLTVTSDNKTKIYGEINPSLTKQYSGFVNGDDESILDVKPVSVTSVLISSDAGNYPIITASGSDNNYDFTYTNGILSVTKANLSVTADDKSKIYGESNPMLTFVCIGFKLTDDVTLLDTKPSISTTADVTSSAGNYPITLSGGSDINYNLVFTSGTLSIGKSTLSVTADDKTRIYGDANPLLTAVLTGFVNNDDESYIDTKPVTSTLAVIASNTGTYVISAAGGTDNNYSFVYVDGVLTINKSTLIVTAVDKTKIYGSDNPVLSVSFSGFKNSDDSGMLDEIPAVSTAALNTSNAGTYVIALSGGSDNNYNLSLVNGSLVIEKAPLEVSAEDKTKVYRQINPALTFTYSGFVLNDNQGVIDVVPVAITGANEASDAGTYDINVSGAADNNYSFLYNKGILTITKADQTITFEEIPDGLRMTQEQQLIAIASSGLPVVFETSDPIVGSLNGSILEINKEGNFTITAMQQGDHNWNPANDVIRSIVTLPTFDNITSLFSPNNDGMNDYWYIPHLEEYGTLQVTVYNRFGQKVYKSDSYKNDWDGTWNGYELPSASYYYIMKSSEKGMLKGVVNLVR